MSCKVPTALVFNVPRTLRKHLYRDLADAGIAQTDDQGRQIDVHALRHTCGTQLARAGVSPQLATRIMRHGSLDMTLKHYTHLTLSDARKAIEMMPDFHTSGSDREAGRKTGTDDQDHVIGVQQGAQKGVMLQAFGVISGHFSARSEKSDKESQIDRKDVSALIGSICHRKGECPGLESNQHDPKVTSPSS